MKQPSDLPERERLVGRYRCERAVRVLLPAVVLACGVSLFALILFLAVPAVEIPMGLAVGLPTIGWLAAGVWVFVRWSQRPSDAELARRADRMLALPDHLTSLNELELAGEWKEAVRRDTRRRFPRSDLKDVWPIRIPGRAWASGATALALTAGALWVGGTKAAEGNQELARIETERQERVEETEEVFEDWEEFVDLTDDPELKEFFTEAAKLREAMDNPDPMEAMMEMGRLEQAMSELQNAIAAESMAADAQAMAEAFEAFEGMSAMAAAMRQQDYQDAAAEAEKIAVEAGQDPEGETMLRRSAAAAEMLANASRSAGKRGQNSMSEALRNLSDMARNAKSGTVPNSGLKLPMEKMRDALRHQQMLEERGRMLSLSKQQIEALRQRVRRDGNMRQPFPSLCNAMAGQGDKPGGAGAGGHEAGTESGGPPLGDPNKLEDPAVAEAVAGMPGEGETEITVTSSASGAVGKASGSREADFQEYEELSRQAVEDETIPLAHRQTIRDYFERIRPANDSP